MKQGYFITAIGTPLTDDEQLDGDALRAQLADQAGWGIDGILAGGTMGAMQLLTDETWRELIRVSAEAFGGEGEVLAGAGDAGFARTRDRIRLLNELKIDGVAVLVPYFWRFSQDELIDYYTALAAESRSPLYLYDLPQLVGMGLSLETVERLAEVENIRGIKCSGPLDQTRLLLDAVGEIFRVIVASPVMADVTLHHGIRDHLDGMWAIVPGWVAQIDAAAAGGDWTAAALAQRKLNDARDLIVRYGMPAFTAMMNARGLRGRWVPRPYASLSGERAERFEAEPILRALVEENPLRGR
jgi:4-hydroxy-tetrahydrodipicolinate synthase